MTTLVLLALVGLGAQLVDGSLGMGHGVTSTTLLLAIGVQPVSASATVHLAQIGTTFASGVAHRRFGNVDWQVVRRLALPGSLGAFLGATTLSRLPVAVAAPVMAVLLLGLGCYVLVRFSMRAIRTDALGMPLRRRLLAPLGFVAGLVSAVGGGGWGPVGTPALLASGRLEPRKVVGSISTSEFFVAVAASAGFLIGIGTAGIHPQWALALLAGGLVAAPLAAWLVRLVPARVLGTAAGGVIVLSNAHTLTNSGIVPTGTALTLGLYAAIVCGCVAATVHAIRLHRRERRQTRARPP